MAADEADARDLGTCFGEDFELVFTTPPSALPGLRAVCDVALTRIGTVTDAGDVTLDGEPLPDQGYTHGQE